MQNLGNGNYQVTKIGLIKMVRESNHNLSLLAAKNYVEDYMVQNTPHLSAAFKTLKDTMAENRISARQVVRLLGITRMDVE